MLDGIDISKWQTATPPLGGLAFVFARASIGLATDQLYDDHARHVRAAGIVLGAYHYWLQGDPAGQVATFLGRSRDADLWAIDLEGAGHTSPVAHAEVRDMIRRIQSTGRKVGLYASDSGYPELGQDYRWIAKWSGPAPSKAWTFWQVGGTGVDHDKFRGDQAALDALANRTDSGGTGVYFLATPQLGKVAVSAGTIAHAYPDPAASAPTKSVKGPTSMAYDQRVQKVGSVVPPTSFAHVTAGPLSGTFVHLGAGVTAVPDPVPPAYSQADLDAATKAGFDDAKGRAITAVQGI